MEKKTDLIEILKNEILKVDKSKITLEHSFNKVSKVVIGPIDDYKIDDLDILEILTSRFARTSDLLVKKIFRVIEAIDLEEKGTIRDLINQAEKKGLISSASIFVRIRELRNLISHEYQEDDLNTIFKEVIKLTPELLESIDLIKEHVKKYEIK
jgi:hypothetical protein